MRASTFWSNKNDFALRWNIQFSKCNGAQTYCNKYNPRSNSLFSHQNGLQLALIQSIYNQLIRYFLISDRTSGPDCGEVPNSQAIYPHTYMQIYDCRFVYFFNHVRWFNVIVFKKNKAHYMYFGVTLWYPLETWKSV